MKWNEYDKIHWEMRCSINSQAIPDKIHGNSITNNKAKDEGKRMLLVLLNIIWINTFWNLHLVDIAFNNGEYTWARSDTTLCQEQQMTNIIYLDLWCTSQEGHTLGTNF